LKRQIDENCFGAPILSDADSILEARMQPTPWWENGDPQAAEKNLRANLDALGVKHLVFGHQPGKVQFSNGVKRSKDELFQIFNGEVFMIDTGMSRGQDASGGALLKIHEGEAEVLFPNGQSRPLWHAGR
jgi:hypothetical protein